MHPYEDRPGRNSLIGWLVGWLVMTINLHCEQIIVSKERGWTKKDVFQPQVISRLLFLTLEGPWSKMDFPGGPVFNKTAYSQLQGAQVWFLVKELRSCLPHCAAENRKEERGAQNVPSWSHPFLSGHFTFLSPTHFGLWNAIRGIGKVGFASSPPVKSVNSECGWLGMMSREAKRFRTCRVQTSTSPASVRSFCYSCYIMFVLTVNTKMSLCFDRGWGKWRGLGSLPIMSFVSKRACY